MTITTISTFFSSLFSLTLFLPDFVNDILDRGQYVVCISLFAETENEG